MADILQRLKGGLIVAIQADENSVLNTAATVSELARCAERNGAAGVRIYGVDCIVAARASVTIPIIGLVKQSYDGFEPYMTSTFEEVRSVAHAGADVIAFDATDRPRHGAATVPSLVAAIKELGLLAHADCSTAQDGRAAAAAGADMLATTLAGYTALTSGRPLPDIDLVRELAHIHPFVVAEGAILTTYQARRAFEAGASAICVGTAITDVDLFVRQYVQVARESAKKGPELEV